jgi:ubiquinone/menaquinone biosynthesis C-methylase UbiE
MGLGVDRSLNYGRHIIEEFASSVQGISRCLDVGAGSGADLDIVRRRHPNAELHAVESWGPNVTTLEAKGVKVTKLNFEESLLPYPDNYFDLIVSNQVIEHTKEIFWTMHEITRVLKVGGHFLIGIPNLGSLHNRLLLLAGLQPTCIQNSSAHIRGFTASDLQKFINIFPEGYLLRKRRGSNFYPFPPMLARPLANFFPQLAWSNFFLFKKVKPYEIPYYRDFPKLNKLETNFKVD